MLHLRLKAAFLLLFRWQGCMCTGKKDTAFICGSPEKHYVVSITKPLMVDSK